MGTKGETGRRRESKRERERADQRLVFLGYCLVAHYFNLKNPFPMSSLRSQILSDVMEEKDILLKYQEAVDTAMGERPHPHPSHPQQQLLGLGLPPLVMQRQPPAPCSSSSPASSSPSPSDASSRVAAICVILPILW